MENPTRIVQGVNVPRFLYGTAWKEEATEGLVVNAITAGFRGFDTANQRKHYFEAGVGAALASVTADGSLRREDLFVQTKFTFKEGQDHRLPYDPHARVADQVAQSFERSLAHLGVTQIDSYILHGPSRRIGWGPLDREAWRAMEALHADGRARLLGVSNVTADQLAMLCAEAEVAPAFVQNRCYASQGWDADVRSICRERDICYQGFSLLTANRAALARPEVRAIAAAHHRTVPQVVFRFALAVGMLPLTGTTDPQHMREDLDTFRFDLAPDEIETLRAIGFAGG